MCGGWLDPLLQQLPELVNPWWRHQMETFSALLTLCAGTSPVTGEFPAQRPVTRGFDVFFDLRLNKRLSKQSWGWWFETPSRSLWRHCNVVNEHISSNEKYQQATGLDAWASRVKCPARFVSHLHEICIYLWVVYSLCFFCCLFITVTWWYVWCFEWASGNQEEVQACLVTLWLFIKSSYSLCKTTLGLLCSWFENNPHFHKYSMDFHV